MDHEAEALLASILSCSFVDTESTKKVEYVACQNRTRTIKKLASILAGGADALHIISDYDSTLTRYFQPNKKDRTLGAWGVLTASSDYISSSFCEADLALYHHYCKPFAPFALRKSKGDGLKRISDPYEMSETLSRSERESKMVEWYTKVMDLILQEKITRQTIRQMTYATRDQIAFRDDVLDVITLCARSSIPFLVFSAGLKDVIDAVLDLFGLSSPTLHVLSNEMIFDEGEDGLIEAFTSPIIHPLNKGEASLKGPERSIVAARPNVILLGDHLGDLEMADGVQHDTCLTIGYLNVNDAIDSTNRATYMASFDLVITHDRGVAPLLLLLRKLVPPPP